MKDENKTKQQLVQELAEMRGRVAELATLVGTLRDSEQALQESEAKYSTLVEQAKDGVVIVQDGVFKFANAAWADICGYPKEEMLGEPFWETLLPDYRELVVERAERRLAGEEVPSVYEVGIQSKDGTVKVVEVSAGIIQYGGRAADMAILRDITERKQTEQALGESEAKLRSLLQSLPDIIYTIAPDHRITFINRVLPGYDLEQVIGSDVCHWVPPEYQDILRESLDQVFRLGETVAFDLTGYGAQGSIAWYSTRLAPVQREGQVVAVLLTARDITDRKQAEEALRDSEALYRLLAENVDDIIWTMDMSLQFTYISPSIERQSGYSVEEIMAMPMEQVYTPASIEMIKKAYAEEMALEKTEPGGRFVSRTLELEACNKDGSTSWVEAQAAIVHSLDGNPIAIQGVTRNIDERKRAEFKLREAYEEERRLSHDMETEMMKRVEFTRALVHELKTPLTAIMASSDLLSEELPEGPMLRLARNVHQGASRLNQRIGELLDLARGEVGMLELSRSQLDPLELLQELAEEITPVIYGREQSLISDLPPSLPGMNADRDRLREVMLNLLGNACKYTPEGGRITLRARVEDSNLVVEVKDTGPGISKEEQAQVFDRYYRGHGERGRIFGLGIGLALSKMLIELHGGKIWLRSQEGKGSTFGFSVPLATADQREEGSGEEEGS